MLFYKIDDDGLALELHVFKNHPKIEIDGEYVDDPKYISEPIPNDIFVSGDYPAKWTGEGWVATGVEPEPQPQEPTELELLMLAITELDMQRELDRTENQVAIAELAESLIGGF